MQSRIVLVVIATLYLLAACATLPKTIPELDRAHAAVAHLASDPLADESASRELQASREALARADRARQDKETLAKVVHLSTLAERHAQIGEARLQEYRARQMIARGEAERTAVLLEARNRQAQAAVAEAGAQARHADAARGEVDAARARLEEVQRKLAELQARRTERGMVLTLGDVLFDTSRAELKAGAAPTLDRIADFLQENSRTRALIEGYTDARGSDEYNRELSRRRAAAVNSALEVRGISSAQIAVAGRGETSPVASNETAGGRQRNRRVEIVFSDAEGQFAESVFRH